ncbi:hypothetical protein OX283_000400 [Flavobacterium sp. SUN052]|uniref:hypothetical protein n=1 Tax=Flavobacterium sp. SUN052 TaxID=3002441 RepID=UPI00237ECFF7|nr:hypothetical protein [Flavobacterium sp. SUN052]MEC4003102.1 hypothetical protein [Flavobacterium sp. SUN052]
MKTKILFLGLALSLFTISCNKDKESNDFSADEAGVNAKIDLANDDVSDVVEAQFNATMDNSTSGKSLETAATATTNLPSCATVTRVPAFGTAPTVGQTVTKTVDFGTTGCPMPNGNILKGQIIISFVYQPTATSHTINYQFVNFYHNAIKFDGNKTFTRTMSVATAASPSHPIVVMTMDLTATFPDGRVFNRVGTRTREIVEGYGTPAILIDNIYHVTGSWTTTFPNTTVQTSTITTPLVVKMSCINVNKPLLVQGVITFVRNGNTATLDYGNGDCDNLAVFTINGNSYTIVIGN